MKQAALDLNLNLKKTCKREFLAQMERVVPWASLVALIAPYYPKGHAGRPPFALKTMLRTHFLQRYKNQQVCSFGKILLRSYFKLKEISSFF